MPTHKQKVATKNIEQKLTKRDKQLQVPLERKIATT